MKTRTKQTLAMITLGICLLVMMAAGGIGCSTGKAAFNPFRRTTNVVETVTLKPAQTNTVVQGTNVLVTIIPAAPLTNYTTNIVVEVNPAFGATIETAKTINGALNPTPTAPFVNIGLSALAGVLGLIAAWKQKAANRALAAHQETNAVLEAVVTGIEVIKDPAARLLAKQSVTQISDSWGRRDLVKQHVDALTP